MSTPHTLPDVVQPHASDTVALQAHAGDTAAVQPNVSSVVALQLHANDTVAVLLHPAAAGDAVHCSQPAAPATTATVQAREPIARFHKIALHDIAPHAPVLRSGMVIGLARVPIRRGDWVHVHNLQSRRARAPAQPIPHSPETTE